jgi:hypothetical protein
VVDSFAEWEKHVATADRQRGRAVFGLRDEPFPRERAVAILESLKPEDVSESALVLAALQKLRGGGSSASQTPR